MSAPRNRTLRLGPDEVAPYLGRCLAPSGRALSSADIENRTIHGDFLAVAPLLPRARVDLLFADPPYELDKTFAGTRWKALGREAYLDWTRAWLGLALPLLRPGASVYVCGDWRSSWALETALSERLTVRNRITWQREKGRSSAVNWKQASEDIWFATLGDGYRFDAEAVKVRKKVLAPYRAGGEPKDWNEEAGSKWRLTGASNLWDDCTVPFWSMSENTDHPTQKPEKLLAKIVLASSRPGELLLDPFLGSGTTSVVAKKLGRRYCGVEREAEYCALAEKRLELAKEGGPIQGYERGYFTGRGDS